MLPIEILLGVICHKSKDLKLLFWQSKIASTFLLWTEGGALGMGPAVLDFHQCFNQREASAFSNSMPRAKTLKN